MLAYATGRRLNDKLQQQSVIVPQQDAPATERGTIVIPRLVLGAGGEEAPRALPNMMEWMRRQIAARISSRSETVSFDKNALQEFPIVFMHGRYDFTFSQEQRELLRDFLSGGGTLLITSICGSEEFSASRSP